MQRLEGSQKIPDLDEEARRDVAAKGVSNAKDWIIRRALGHRIELQGKDAAANFEKIQGTEKISQRAYL